ncbi:hypothetical protein BgiMline_025789 [Biomphalaria glabrata]|nr:hypothetical protein BgiMline_021832 [Biomphalaria glabrata]KAI8778231.1 hypothetical protein BgiBS90_020881 [Biomphalaria glabrata]
MSSFFKFFGKKTKKDDADIKIDPNVDPELEKRRLRHSLSISRSGRFKQKKRERSQISDKPEIFFDLDDAPSSEAQNENKPAAAGGHSTSQPGRGNHSGAPTRSPKACRDVNPPLTSKGGLRVGQSVAT